MYTSDKPRPVDFYMGEVRGMMIEIVDNNNTPNTTLQSPQHQQRMVLGESSGGEEHENIKAPKKRAETWIQEEIRSLINFRREVDCVFNTSKSNKHLWDQISCRMREKGFDRSASMCTDKWRNLLKEFKKARHKERGGAFAKLSYYKELEELLRERSKKSPKVGSYVQFADKGLEDANIPFGSIEGSGRPTLNHERRVDHNRHPLAITATDSVATHGLPPWNWRSTSGNGGENQPYDGRVITVKWREYTKRIGIDGSADAIKEAIKSAFGLRTQRAFWLEDEDEVIRTLDRDMPLGNYTLHLDEGVSIKICIFDESENLQIQTEEKTLYTEDDYRDFLGRRGWSGLREMNDFRCVDTLNDIRTGAMYHGVRMVRD